MCVCVWYTRGNCSDPNTVTLSFPRVIESLPPLFFTQLRQVILPANFVIAFRTGTYGWVQLRLQLQLNYLLTYLLTYLLAYLQLYNMLIRPVVTYASETWLLKENVIKKLTIFERRIMRKIFGPTRTDDGYWRIKSNQ